MKKVMTEKMNGIISKMLEHSTKGTHFEVWVTYPDGEQFKKRMWHTEDEARKHAAILSEKKTYSDVTIIKRTWEELSKKGERK